MVAILSVNAQEYHPFPSEYARWVYHYNMEGLDYYTFYYLNRDTIINQTTYHVINRKRQQNRQGELYILEDIYFREEDKRIYFINTLDKEKEILTYDFNIAVGDTFYLESFDTLVVKDENFEDGRRELLLECLNVDYLGVKLFDVWIEGIGSRIDFEKPNVYSSLMCFKGDNEQSNSCGVFDEVLALDKSNIVQSKHLIYPNPTFDNLYFQTDYSKYKQFKIFDLNAKLIKSGIIDKNNTDVSNLPNGIYVIQFIGDEVTLTDKFEKTNKR